MSIERLSEKMFNRIYDEAVSEVGTSEGPVGPARSMREVARKLLAKCHIEIYPDADNPPPKQKKVELNLQPQQPLYRDREERIRFRQNGIVKFLAVDDGPHDMNRLMNIPFDQADRIQFAQLIGYDLVGFSTLPYVTDEAYEAALAATPEIGK